VKTDLKSKSQFQKNLFQFAISNHLIWNRTQHCWVGAVACVFLADRTNPVTLMLQCCVWLWSHMRKQLLTVVYMLF